MRDIKIPQQDFAQKIQGAYVCVCVGGGGGGGGGEVYLRDTTVLKFETTIQ